MASSDAWRGVKVRSWGEDSCLDMVEEARGVGDTGCRLGSSLYFFFHFIRERADQCLKIDETAQKNTVLTVYELIHGDATISQGMYVSWN